MAQLTYWALQQYPHVPAVAKGRAALAKQMTSMGLNQWRMHRHVCESKRGEADERGAVACLWL